MLTKVMLIMEIDDSDIGKIGDKIVWHNDEFNANWKLKKIPAKKIPNGSDIFNDYVNGWNDCVDAILGDDNG